VWILALETVTPAGSVALADGELVVATRAGDPSRPHVTRLPGDLLELLQSEGRTLASLDRLAVCLGPGGFTGLRIGIAAVQGLSTATGLLVAGVSALDALAAAAAARSPRPSSVAVWLEGGRGEVFAARYIVQGERLQPVGEPVAAPPQSVLEQWRDKPPMPMTWIGEGMRRYAPLIRATPDVRHADLLDPTPLIAPWVATLSARLPAGRPHALQPVYVRRPDAELARARRAPGPVEP